MLTGLQAWRGEDSGDRENAHKEVLRAELLARLTLLDQEISKQASRTEFVRERGWNATAFERRSKLLKTTREHYVALLKLLLDGGSLPMLWNDLDPDAATYLPPSGQGTR